jgi:hypothetical protein
LLDLASPESKDILIKAVIPPKTAGFDPSYYFNIKGEE